MFVLQLFLWVGSVCVCVFGICEGRGHALVLRQCTCVLVCVWGGGLEWWCCCQSGLAHSFSMRMLHTH